MTPQTITPQDISMSTLDCTPTTDDINVTAAGFINLNLSADLLKALAEMNFTNPSSIQAESIPQIMGGNDIIAKAPTGSGKTAAFAIPIIEKLDLNSQNKNVQALVLCPTRELAIQVHREFEKLTQFMFNVSVVSVYGGQQIEKQLSALKKNPQIVVATPGRLMDHLRRGSISLDTVGMVVLDEADEMLDMGFREDIHTILEDTPVNRQTILFSATMAKDIQELTKRFQKSPNIVDVTDNMQNAPDIEQLYYEVSESDKIELLVRLLDLHSVKLALVFCNTKSNVDKVVEILKTRGYLSDALHGDMNQAQREKVMRGFRNGGVEILVATDVAGRGIDVKNLQAVFNYDLPRDDEDYVHRIGRTARAGKSGVAMTFISKKQVQHIRRIERANGVQIIKKEIPTIEELENSRVLGYFETIKNIVSNSDLSAFNQKINSMINEDVSMLNIASALLKMTMDADSKKINSQVVFEVANDEDRSGSRRRGSRGGRDRDRRGGGRGERSEHGGRAERSGRGYRIERSEKQEFSERAERSERQERSYNRERGERSERGFSRERAERSERPAKSERNFGRERSNKGAESKSAFGSNSRGSSGGGFGSSRRKERESQLDAIINEARSFGDFSKRGDKKKSASASSDKSKSFGKSFSKSKSGSKSFGQKSRSK